MVLPTNWTKKLTFDSILFENTLFTDSFISGANWKKNFANITPTSVKYSVMRILPKTRPVLKTSFSSQCEILQPRRVGVYKNGDGPPPRKVHNINVKGGVSRVSSLIDLGSSATLINYRSGDNTALVAYWSSGGPLHYTVCSDLLYLESTCTVFY